MQRPGARRPTGQLEIDEWKKEEVEFISQHDIADADVWFLIDLRWLEEWKAFLKSGAGLPGPIDNSRLVDRRSGKPCPGLRLKEDYRGVSTAVWKFWHARYGGGPEVRRGALDLYAAPPDDASGVSLLPGLRSQETEGSAADGLDGTKLVQRPRQIDAMAAVEDNLEETKVVPRRQQQLTAAAAHSSLPAAGAADRADTLEATKIVQRPGRASAAPAVAGAPFRALFSSRALTPSSSRVPGLGRSRQDVAASREVLNSRGRGRSVPPRRVVDSQDQSDRPPCCGRCDGAHEDDECPHFRRVREKHRDAWTMVGKAKLGGINADEVAIVKGARVVSQPGDGSCLFHALSYGLGESSGTALRRDICDFIANNPEAEIGGNTLEDWIRYDGGGSLRAYAAKMSHSSWGGGIEMAVFSKMKRANVHVYERCREGHRRISAFEVPGTRKIINVVYQGRSHYDALVL